MSKTSRASMKIMKKAMMSESEMQDVSRCFLIQFHPYLTKSLQFHPQVFEAPGFRSNYQPAFH